MDADSDQGQAGWVMEWGSWLGSEETEREEFSEDYMQTGSWILMLLCSITFDFIIILENFKET